jgi:hypothetical protein
LAPKFSLTENNHVVTSFPGCGAHRYAQVAADVVPPAISFLALGEKQVATQTFQVLKTWKV